MLLNRSTQSDNSNDSNSGVEEENLAYIFSSTAEKYTAFSQRKKKRNI